MCLQVGDKEHVIRVHVEITMKGSDVPLGSCIPRRLDGIFPSILGAKKTSSQWPKHPLLPVVGEEGPCPRVSYLLLRGQRGLFCWSPPPSKVPIVRTYANQMQGQMCTQKINKLLTSGIVPLLLRSDPFCLHVRDGNGPLDIQVNGSRVLFGFGKKPICLQTWAVKCL